MRLLEYLLRTNQQPTFVECRMLPDTKWHCINPSSTEPIYCYGTHYTHPVTNVGLEHELLCMRQIYRQKNENRRARKKRVQSTV